MKKTYTILTMLIITILLASQVSAQVAQESEFLLLNRFINGTEVQQGLILENLTIVDHGDLNPNTDLYTYNNLIYATGGGNFIYDINQVGDCPVFNASEAVASWTAVSQLTFCFYDEDTNISTRFNKTRYNSFDWIGFTDISTAPNITNINITPSPAYTNDTLTPICTATDPENHSLTYTYQWYENNASVSEPLNLDAGEEFFFTCTATDPYSLYDQTNSTPITILEVPCTPNWECTEYAECISPATNTSCTNVTDTNTCGDNYTGNYTEFPTQICSYPSTSSGTNTNYLVDEQGNIVGVVQNGQIIQQPTTKTGAPLLSFIQLEDTIILSDQTLIFIAIIIALAILGYALKKKPKRRKKR